MGPGGWLNKAILRPGGAIGAQSTLGLPNFLQGLIPPLL